MSFFGDPASWVLVAFIIFVILALVAKAPSMIAKILDSEIERIKNELNDARKLKEDANSLLADYERKVQNAQKEIEKILDQAKTTAKNHDESARKKVEEYIKRAEQQSIEKITQTEKMALSKVNQEIVSNSIEVAEKIVSENITEDNSKKLFSQSVQQIKKLKI
jgi:F-type H+-transporting ATPase subunit b|tara:strand:+ start:1034 stop:1525 length:492 start_codon:yes stop_codon:yes gene_type:complete